MVSTAYNANFATVTDQSGKLRRSMLDGLGQLVRVDEPDATGNLGATTSPAQATSYSYDALSNLTQLTQGIQSRTFVYSSLARLTSATSPEGGTVNHTYDNNGNLLTKTDARSIMTTVVYDALNRLTNRTYSDGTPAVTYIYDAASVTNSKGRLTAMSSSVSATNYTAYDALGRFTNSNQMIDGQTYTLSYSYNRASGQTALTYPSGRVVQTKHDAAGRIAGIKDQQSAVYYAGAIETDATNRMQYAAHGAVKIMKLGNGLWEHTDFNTRLQMTHRGLGTSSTSSSTLGLTYGYGATTNNGNPLSVAYAGGGLSYTQTFGYDQLNRLTTAAENGSSWSQTNKYDRYGNRAIDLGGGNQSLSFNTANNRTTNLGHLYDAVGNLTSDGTQSFAYDAENKVKTVNGENSVYRYDGDGHRVRKNFIAGEKVRMIYSCGQLIAEYDLANGSLKKEYVYGAKGLIATIGPGAGTKYATADHLGSPRIVTGSTGSVISRHDYMPFGEEVVAGVGGRTPGMGFSGNDGLRQKFTSKERENETGLDYFVARYYASTQGRFTSTDPVVLTPDRLHDPQRLNLYAYTRNSPLVFQDPTGEDIVVEGGTPEQQEAVRAAIATLRAQSATAENAFRTYDPQQGGRGPNLTIAIMNDADFSRLSGVTGSQTMAVTSPQGGDDLDQNIQTGAEVVIRSSAVDASQETTDRSDRKETLVEGILSHEVPGHARDITANPAAQAKRFSDDSNLNYQERRNEISADRATKRVGIERVIRGEINASDLRRDVRFGRKLHP